MTLLGFATTSLRSYYELTCLHNSVTFIRQKLLIKTKKTEAMANEKVTSISKPKTIDVLMKGTAVLENKPTMKSKLPKKSIDVEQQFEQVSSLSIFFYNHSINFLNLW